MRLIELSDLHVFRTVVRAGGVTRASERLHRVQSNVTTRIKKLEEDLDVALFSREGKKLRLTPAGDILLGYADRLLELAEEARNALQDSTPRGVLRLGAMESTAAVRLPAPLSKLHELYPEISVELRTDDPRTLTAQVLNGELDAALVAEPVSDPRLDAPVVFDEQIVLVAGARHSPIATPRDIANRTMLAFHPGCPYRKRLEDWFAADAVPIERVVELASYHAILGCAVAGMGVAFLPRSVLDSYGERSRLSVHELSADIRAMRTLLIWRRAAAQAKIQALASLLGVAPAPGASRPPPRR